MRGFKDSYKGQAKVKTRKNRKGNEDNDFQFRFFLNYRYNPEFMSEDMEFNIDAELEADYFALA